MNEQIDYSYKRGFDKNYLVIKGNENADAENDYQYRMLAENTIKNLLSMEMKLENGIYNFYYEISSMQPLERLFEHREIDGNNLRLIISGIINAYSNAFEYMLQENHFILSPKFIYTNAETKEISLLFFPGITKEREDVFIEFAEYLLDHVDHQDAQAVMIAYQLYKSVKEGNFTLKDINNIVDQSKDAKSKDEEIDEFEKRFTDSNENYVEDEFYEEPYDNVIKKESFAKKLFGGILLKTSRNTQGVTEKKQNEFQHVEEVQKIGEKQKEVPRDIPKDISNEEYGKTVILVPEHDSKGHVLIQNARGKEIIYDLDNLPITIGKLKEQVDIALKDSSVSRIHAKIFSEGNDIFIMDCNSTNGTFINGMQLDSEERIMLETGDEISIGKVKLEYR